MERLVFVFFIYGLAFFSMGLAIALELRGPSDLALRRPLRYLAVFGLLHGAVEWIDMWLIGPAAPAQGTGALRIIRLALFGISTVALAQFGADLIAALRPRWRFIRWLPTALALFWAANSVIPHLLPVTMPGVAGTASCARCHLGGPPPDAAVVGGGIVPFGPATALADIWLRYLVYLPGSLLAAVGFWLEGRRLAAASYVPIARSCRWTALAFAANAVMAGFIVPPARMFPASVFNYDRFLSVVGVPPQLFRAAIAVAIAVLVVRVLRIFETDVSRRLAAATNARLAAQQEALDTVQRARLEAETWTRTLEERVVARTAELERRSRELAALNAIASTVTSSLDLRPILEAALDQVLALVGAEGGGVRLFPVPPGGAAVCVVRGPVGTEVERVGPFEPGSLASGQVTFADGTVSRPFLSVPLHAKDRLLGALVVLGPEDGRFGDDTGRLLSTAAQQIGVAVENARLFGESAARRREAETLYHLGTEITALSDLPRVLELVTASARDLLDADAATLSLVDEGAGRIVIRAAAGLRGEALLGVALTPGQGLAGRVVQTGRPLVVADYVSDQGITHELDELVRGEGLQTHVGVPVSARGRTLGCLAVAYRRVRAPAEDDVRLLTRMANQAAIAIENARLYERVQSLAILEERDRLGREMHDSLGQSLGLLNLKVKLVEDLLAGGRDREAEDELAQMRQTIREAYDEVRHAILGLRTSGAREDLEVALRVQVTRFREQTKLPVTLDVRGPVPPVPALAAVQITRVVQEALTNVRKHAEATEVRVSLELEDGRLAVRVADNGRGFDIQAVQAASEARFGLETMRERAESIGATLEITSRPGRGTTVALRLPLGDGGDPAAVPAPASP